MGFGLAFYRYYFFRRNLGWRILILVVGSVWLGSIRSSNQPFHLGVYLFQALIVGVVIALLYAILYAAAVLRLKRQTKKADVIERSFTITLDTDGFHVLSAEGEAKFCDGRLSMQWVKLYSTLSPALKSRNLDPETGQRVRSSQG